MRYQDINVKSLEDVALPTLKKLIRHPVRQMAKTSAQARRVSRSRAV